MSLVPLLVELGFFDAHFCAGSYIIRLLFLKKGGN